MLCAFALVTVARCGKHFTPSKKSHIEDTAGATWQTRELILRPRQGIIAAGRRRVEARDGSCTRFCIQSHWNRIESLERVFIVTAQWDSTARLRSSVLEVPNTMEECKYPPQMMMWNFKYCHKKTATVSEACWVWCGSLEWPCWLTLARASSRVTS